MARPATSSTRTEKKSRAPKGSGNIPCTMCTKKFTRTNDVKRHKEIHSKTLYFRCSVTGCTYTTPVENEMKEHNICVHKKRLKKGKSGGRRSHMRIPPLKRSTTPESQTLTLPPRAASIAAPSSAIAPTQHQSPSTYASSTSKIPACPNPSTTPSLPPRAASVAARSTTAVSTQHQSSESSTYATSTSSGSSSSLLTSPYTPHSHPSIILNNATPTPSPTPQSPIWNTLGVCLMPPFQLPEVDAPLPPSTSTTSSSTACSATRSPNEVVDIMPQAQNYCTPPQWQCSDGYTGPVQYVPPSETAPAPTMANACDRRVPASPAPEVNGAPSWAPTQLQYYSTAPQSQRSSEYAPDPSYMPPTAPGPAPPSTYANVNAWDRRIPTALAPQAEVVGAPNWATSAQFQNYSAAPQRQWSSEYTAGSYVPSIAPAPMPASANANAWDRHVPHVVPALVNASTNAWDMPTHVAAPPAEVGGAPSWATNVQLQNYYYTDVPQLQRQSTGGYYPSQHVAPAAPISQAAPVSTNTWDKHVPAAFALKVEDTSSWDTNTQLENYFTAPQIQRPWNSEHAPGPSAAPALINIFDKRVSMPAAAPEVQHYFNTPQIQGAEWNVEYAPVQYFPPAAYGYAVQPPQQYATYPTPTVHTPSMQYYNPLAGTPFIPTQISMTYHYSSSQLNHYSR